MFLAVQYVIYQYRKSLFQKAQCLLHFYFFRMEFVLSQFGFYERAIIPLFFASLVIYRTFYWHAEPFYLNYFLILTGTFCAYIAILFFDFGKIDLSVQISQFLIGEVLFCWVLWLQF